MDRAIAPNLDRAALPRANEDRVSDDGASGFEASGTATLVLLRRCLSHHAWLLAYTLAYLAVVIAVLHLGGYPHDLLMVSYLVSALLPPLAAVLFVAIGHVLQHALHVRPFRWAGLAAAIRHDERFTKTRVIFALIPSLLFPIFGSTFTSFKNAIPAIVPFSYDRDFMLLDRVLHFGRDPWVLLQPLLGDPLVTSITSYLYNFWLPLMYLIFYWQVFSLKSPLLRMQYLLSFVLLWSLAGNLLALLMSSAGPWLYPEITGLENPYEPLRQYLLQADLIYKNWSLEAQAYLWELYQAEAVASGGGISAMPSLHVAIAVLQALLGWRLSRRLGLILTAYAAVVMLGSVHLAWHYAVDGYLSILLAVIVWKATGWAIERRPARAWAFT